MLTGDYEIWNRNGAHRGLAESEGFELEAICRPVHHLLLVTLASSQDASGAHVFVAEPTGVGSPLIVDTNHSGFHMTDPQTACITFDIEGTGNPVCVSWPEHGSGGAWLVYDADGSGIISSGKELFGNFTPHADADGANRHDPNGFLALEWYDQPAQGGNLDLIIDKRDRIWNKLKLWIDDHCYKTPDVPCVSATGELHPLEEFGISSISLVYTGANDFTDAFQNHFKFSAVLNPDAKSKPLNEKKEACCDQHQHSNDGRLIYDVYLQPKK